LGRPGRGWGRLEAGAGSVAGFELAVEDESGERSFFRGRLNLALKNISAAGEATFSR
jgi:hypothetical protein